jgi:membrane peptidoglycan carboxypeptidase
MPTLDHYVAELSHLPLYADNHQVTDRITDALVAAEDRNFYTHHGVDWEAVRRSANEDVRSMSFSHGGSTITMQTVRYTMLPYSKTPARKIAQTVLALRLERRLSKQQILRLYFDSVSFGLHTAGLESAAKTYFNKRPEKLTLAECAFLVGAISHPPATTAQVTPEYAHARTDTVLAHMEPLFAGKYDADEFEQARQGALHFAWDATAKVSATQVAK